MRLPKLNRKEFFLHNYKIFRGTSKEQVQDEKPTTEGLVFPILVLCAIALSVFMVLS